ncbi:hypothetical protein BDY24DRAFT_376364 [Mrakia frigida]|uniref:cytoplasmic tRNA 2-thiolation protein 2 n=1 Tax=Mrakia frigida TaxID=29902 RepID=UPI003FCC0160
MSCSNPPESDSLNPDGDAPEKMMERKPKLDSSICIRCKEEKGILVVRHSSYCKNCLPSFVLQKFTRSIVPHLPPLPSSSSRRAASTSAVPITKPPVLLACSGGSSSLSLLEMFHRSYCSSGPRGRERWGRIVVAWVDFGREGGEEMGAYLKKVVEERWGWEWRRVGVEEAFEREGGLIGVGSEEELKVGVDARMLSVSVEGGRVLKTTLLPSSSDASSSSPPTSHYQTLLSTLPTPSHPAITSSLLSSLLTRLAISLSSSSPTTNPTLFLTGLTATRAASLIISQTASGGGYALPLLVAPTTTHVVGVKVVRPMTQLSGKEVGWFARSCGLRSWNLGSMMVGGGGKGSIEKLTGDFVQSLDRSHPSTVSTIARTASKLIFSGNADSPTAAWTGRVCPLCELPADPSPKEWLSLTSLTSLPTTPLPPTSSNEPPLEHHLCYSCLTTLVSPAGAAGGGAPPPRKEGEEPARLPAWTMGNLVRERRKEVGEMLMGEGWLLSEEDD